MNDAIVERYLAIQRMLTISMVLNWGIVLSGGVAIMSVAGIYTWEWGAAWIACLLLTINAVLMDMRLTKRYRGDEPSTGAPR